MAGEGKRFQNALPKQFHPIHGKKIYLYTLEKFIESKLFEEIILVCPSAFINEVKKEIVYLQKVQLISVVQGGLTRQESSYKGLLTCGTDTKFVLIHDGVRPFVSLRELKENLKSVKIHHAVDTCIPSTDTLVHSRSGTLIDQIPKRTEYLRGLTPQTFSYPLILRAHEEAIKKGICNATDDCSLVLVLNHPVFILIGEESNMKITTEQDLMIAEKLAPIEKNRPKKQNSLQGKHIVITGGMGGIGQAICKKLEQEGAIPIPISRSSPYFSVNLSLPDQVEKTFQSIYDRFGLINGLINSVGTLSIKNLTALSPEEIQEQLAVNLLSYIYCCKYAKIVPNGHIVNIASSCYSKGRKNYPIYSAAKAAIVNFTQSLAEERTDLFVNAIAPERTNTKMRTTNFKEENPLSLLSPNDVAEEIVKLLKQNGTTGSIIELTLQT